jgi:hypothetical protein
MSKQIGFIILGVFGVLEIVGVSIFSGLFDRIVDRDAKSPALRWTLQLSDHISSLQIRSKLEI